MNYRSSSLSSAIVLVLACTASAHAANTAGLQNQTRELAIQRANSAIQYNAAAVHASANDRFVASDAIVDSNGAEHVRMNRSYRGLPVIGGDFVVHTDNTGKLASVSQTLRNEINVNTRASLDKSEAVLNAGVDFGSDFEGVSDAKLVIFANGKSPTLAYEVVFNGFHADQTPTEMHYFIDANSGGILGKWDSIHTKGKPGGGGGGGATCNSSAGGTGRTLFSGNVPINTTGCTDGSFQMKDLTRGGGYTTDLNQRQSGSGTIFTDSDNSWGNNTTSDRASAAADAHFGVAETWDYFLTVHGRNGIANDGQGALSRVHYGRNYVNAFWSDSCFCMTFGDGNGSTYAPLVDLDVAGHEMSHGVTSRTANLNYSGESGGLNEATSDIFGTMVEFLANNAYDQPDYLIGEEIYINNPGNTKALRYMYNPILDGSSPNCYSSSLGSLDVHYSSGVANHFFYLLAEGTSAKTFSNGTITSPTCNGSSLAGVGRSKAEKIWYRALTVYMTSNTNYSGARAATISAANDLYGSATASAVADTWSAVSVN
jgi:zinc metalloprotease ZmpA